MEASWSSKALQDCFVESNGAFPDHSEIAHAQYESPLQTEFIV